MNVANKLRYRIDFGNFPDYHYAVFIVHYLYQVGIRSDEKAFYSSPMWSRIMEMPTELLLSGNSNGISRIDQVQIYQFQPPSC